MSAGVGFASSANQTSAAQAKKQKRRAKITPLESKAETRAKLAGVQTRQHDAIRESWLEIIAVMQTCIRPYPTYAPAPVEPVVKAPVVFEEVVVAYDDPDAIATVKQAAEVFEDEPAPVVETPVLLLPAFAEGVMLLRKSPARRALKVYWQRRTRPSGDVIELPAPDYAAEAAEARAAIRAEYEAEMGVTLPERVGVDVGRPKFWFRNDDGTLEKRYVS